MKLKFCNQQCCYCQRRYICLIPFSFFCPLISFPLFIFPFAYLFPHISYPFLLYPPPFAPLLQDITLIDSRVTSPASKLIFKNISGTPNGSGGATPLSPSLYVNDNSKNSCNNSSNNSSSNNNNYKNNSSSNSSNNGNSMGPTPKQFSSPKLSRNHSFNTQQQKQTKEMKEEARELAIKMLIEKENTSNDNITPS